MFCSFVLVVIFFPSIVVMGEVWGAQACRAGRRACRTSSVIQNCRGYRNHTGSTLLRTNSRKW